MEFRLHGIGEHEAASGLGSSPRAHIPASESDDPPNPDKVHGVPGAVDEFGKPRLPEHNLVILVWSRFSRRLARFLWFVAMPFSLVNIAAEMRAAPDVESANEEEDLAAVRRVDRSIVRMTRYVWGPLISVGALIWVIAWAETLMRSIDLGILIRAAPWNVEIGPHVGWILALALAASFWLRQFKTEVRVDAALLAVHSITVVAAGFALSYFRPTSIEVVSPLLGWANNPDGFIDPIRVYCVAGGLLVLLWWLYLAARQQNDAYRRLLSAAWWGSGFAITAAFVLVNAGGSMLRLGLDWFGRYVRSHVDSSAGAELLPPASRTVLPANNGGADEWIDLVPLGLLPILIVVSVLLLAGGRSDNTALVDAGGRKRLVHNAIDRLPHTARLGNVAGAIVVWLLAVFVLWTAVTSSRVAHSVAVIAVHFLGAVLTVWFLSGGKLGGRKFGPTLSRVADVVGFWPIRSHPFAGLSYRDAVVTVLRDRLVQWQTSVRGDPIVFAGHSQGSVLAAWMLQPVEATAAKLEPQTVHLVTCGSPLRSLYGAFFTAHFSASFFEDVRAFSAGWHNFWRVTDPIATKVECADNVEIEDNNQDDRGRPTYRGHGDYWIEDLQMGAIDDWHRTATEQKKQLQG